MGCEAGARFARISSPGNDSGNPELDFFCAFGAKPVVVDLTIDDQNLMRRTRESTAGHIKLCLERFYIRRQKKCCWHR